MTELEDRIKGIKKSYPMPKWIGNDTALDIGCNLGAFPLVYASRFKKIFFLEASKKNYDLITKNLKDVHNCRGLNLSAYSQSNINKKVYEHKNMSNGSRGLLDHEEWLKDNFEESITISFKDTLNIFEIQKIDYLKIDIEGSEYDYLIDNDLSMVSALGIEIHSQMGEKKCNALMKYLLNYFNLKDAQKNSHIEAFYINKNIKV